MNPGDVFEQSGKVFYVRAVDGDVVEAIEDGVGDPADPNFEPGADLLQTFSLAALTAPPPPEPSAPFAGTSTWSGTGISTPATTDTSTSTVGS